MRALQLLKAYRGIIILLAIGLSGWGGYRGFIASQQGRLVRHARGFLNKGDFRSAALSARQALQSDANNLEACRVMAEMAGRAGVRETVYWRRRVAELEPSKLENRLAWARDALQFGEMAEADRALLSASSAERQTAAYHEMAASLALALNRPRSAEFHFAEAARLDPGDEMRQLNLATVRLQSANSTNSAEARATLARLAEKPDYRELALRALVADAMREGDWGRALRLVGRLIADPSSQFSDGLTRLEILHRAKHADFATCLQQLQGRAARQGGNLFALASWMKINGMAAPALEWLRALPPAMFNDPMVKMAMADCSAVQKDWGGLRAAAQTGDWGALDFLRLAIMARVMREEGDVSAWRNQWRAAVAAAAPNSRSLVMLARTIEGWGWKPELEELLWDISRGGNESKWALKRLYGQYQKDGNSRGLYRVVSRVLEIDPKDAVARNNLALLGLLLNLQTGHAFEIAQELYRKDPANTAFASTYAYALHCQNRTAEGLRILNALKDQERKIPAVATYYGVLLAASGEGAKARQYLDLAGKDGLLPEEKQLVRRAQETLK